MGQHQVIPERKEFDPFPPEPIKAVEDDPCEPSQPRVPVDQRVVAHDGFQQYCFGVRIGPTPTSLMGPGGIPV